MPLPPPKVDSFEHRLKQSARTAVPGATLDVGISTEVILNRARDYFRVQLSKSLELAFLLPTDSKVDLGREVAGTKLFEAKLREELKYQCFSQSIQSDAFTLLHPTNPDPDAKPSDAFQIACNAILRAKIENARILVARNCRPATVGDQRDSNNSDAWYSCIFLDRRATSGVAAPRHCVQATLRAGGAAPPAAHAAGAVITRPIGTTNP